MRLAALKRKFTPWFAIIGVVMLGALVYRAFYYAKKNSKGVWETFVLEARYFFNA